jgi:outer membrane protein assembly factor BamB
MRTNDPQALQLYISVDMPLLNALAAVARCVLHLTAAVLLLAGTPRLATALPLHASAPPLPPPFHHDRGGNGTGDLLKLTAAGPSIAWRHKCDSAIEADGAFAADGTFYVGCLGGYLYAINPSSGHRMWQFNAGGAIFAAPVIAADGRSGHDTRPDVMHRSPLPPNRSLLLSSGNSLYNLSISSDSAGSVFWKYTADDWVYSSAVVANDGAILFGSFDQAVYSLTRFRPFVSSTCS